MELKQALDESETRALALERENTAQKAKGRCQADGIEAGADESCTEGLANGSCATARKARSHERNATRQSTKVKKGRWRSSAKMPHISKPIQADGVETGGRRK